MSVMKLGCPRPRPPHFSLYSVVVSDGTEPSVWEKCIRLDSYASD